MSLIDGGFVVAGFILVGSLVVLFALLLGDRVETGFRYHGAELFLRYWRKRK